MPDYMFAFKAKPKEPKEELFKLYNDGCYDL